MQVHFKKLLVLLLLLGLAGCMTSKKPSATTEAFPGLPDGSETEVVFEEPDPDTGNRIDQTEEEEPAEVCTPVEIIPTGELPAGAVAGEDYATWIEVEGACGFVACQLLSEQDWVTMDGCQLYASPENLGEQEITIRATNMRNEAEFVERTLTLTVRDEPKINLFVSSSDSPAIKKLQNVGEKDRRDFDVTLDHDYLYAWIEGYAEEYDVTIDSDQLTRAEVANNLHSISLATSLNPNQEELTLNDVRITAETEHGTVSRVFNVRFLKNPCDHPLRVERAGEVIAYNNDGTIYSTHQDVNPNSTGINVWNTDVILGKKYRILFKVVGGIGPYEWSEPFSEVKPQQDCVDPTDPFGDFQFGCSDNVLTTNDSWVPVEPFAPTWIGPEALTPEERDNKVYFQLDTAFIFRGKDLPYNEERDNMIYDQLTVTATSQGCPNNPPATYTLNHVFTLPREPISDITCEQTVEDVWDVQSNSRMWIYFSYGEYTTPMNMIDSPPNLGYVEYKIDECEYEGHDVVITRRCEVPRDISRIFDPTAFVDGADHITIVFRDETEGDGWCWDCDYDEADYDLKTLSCYSNYRTVFYSDADNELNDNVVGCAACGSNATSWVSDGYGEGGMDYTSYPLSIPRSDGKIFHPRIRPNYPPLVTE